VTRTLIYLEDGDIAEIARGGVRIVRADGSPVERPEHESTLVGRRRRAGHYRHYMQKEIFEQPQALANTLEMIGTAQSAAPQLFGAGAERNASPTPRAC
jgi:glucosamine--fructose-6-phosphate aminotransferase (isomerizing)